MRYALLFLAVAAAVFAYQEILGKRDRRKAVGLLRKLLLPSAVGAACVVVLLVFNLNFNGKII